MSIPLQSGCNPNDPEEHALWALTGLAGPNSQAPLILPVAVTKLWSKHLYDCGYRHHPELQKIKYIPPAAGTNWVVGAAGEWVDINTPLTPQQSAPDISHLSDEEQLVLLSQLIQRFQPPQEADNDNA